MNVPSHWSLLVATLRFIEPHGLYASDLASEVRLKTAHPMLVCVGRLRVTIPGHAEISWTEPSSEQVGGRIVTSGPVTKAAFKSEIEQRADRFRKLKHRVEDSRLHQVIDIDDDVSVLLVRPTRSNVTDFDVYGYRWSNDRIRSVQRSAERTSVNRVVDEVVAGLRRIEHRAANEVPTRAGWCLEDGLVRGNSRYESAGVHIVWPNFPGLEMWLSTESDDQPMSDEEKLTARVAKLEELEFVRDAAVIRDLLQRRIGGRAGMEYVRQMRIPNSGVLWSGLAQVDYVPGDPRQPSIVMGFDLTLSDQDGATADGDGESQIDEALRLWDAVIDGVQVRPGAF